MLKVSRNSKIYLATTTKRDKYFYLANSEYSSYSSNIYFMLEDEDFGLNYSSTKYCLTDIDPNTPNKLIVKWKNNSFIIKDAARIKRFGEVSKTIKSSNKTEKDAVAFAYHEWNKLLKNDGRKLECKVDGAPKWRIGQWVRVYIPSFGLNWKTNLTLEDYPPDLGEKPSENSSKKASSSSSTASNSTSNSSSSSSSSDTSNNNDGGDS